MPETIFCSKCGCGNISTSQFCQRCGESLWPAGVAAIPASAVSTVAVAALPGTRGYGGFWMRVLAFIIDIIVVRIAMIPVLALFGLSSLHRVSHMNTDDMQPRDILFLASTGMAAAMLLFCAHWLYEALFTSSSWQATLGKRALGLIVTDEVGRRLSFARATGRFFAKMLSWATACIGFIIAAFSQRKRALHDIIAGTLVFKT